MHGVLHECTLHGFYSKYSEALCPKQLGSKVLDIGCSNGIFLNIMGDKGWNGMGIDISDYIIQKAKQQH